MKNIIIRKGNENDAKGVVEVNTYTWLTTYKGLMPDRILNDRVKNMEERIPKTAVSIKENDNLYVAEDKGKIVGFMSYGKSRNKKYENHGEIYAIYILKDYQGLGLGKKLFMIGLEELSASGFETIILNVLDGNKTINFYKKYGGVEIGVRYDDFDGIILTEKIMCFENISDIVMKNKKTCKY